MLLATLKVLVPMLALLEMTSVSNVRTAAGPVLSLVRAARPDTG